jgi:hypothetical protein
MTMPSLASLTVSETTSLDCRDKAAKRPIAKAHCLGKLYGESRL